MHFEIFPHRTLKMSEERSRHGFQSGRRRNGRRKISSEDWEDEESDEDDGEEDDEDMEDAASFDRRRRERKSMVVVTSKARLMLSRPGAGPMETLDRYIRLKMIQNGILNVFSI